MVLPNKIYHKVRYTRGNHGEFISRIIASNALVIYLVFNDNIILFIFSVKVFVISPLLSITRKYNHSTLDM
jgi:hypothetical protein